MLDRFLTYLPFMETTSRRSANAPIRTTRIRSGTPTKSPLIFTRDLPGPMSMRRLCDMGILIPLGHESAFLSSDARTLFGRAAIASALVPTGSAACASLAAWIWNGGTFPDTIDVISRSHYRAPIYGRLIRVYNRAVPPDHLRRMGRLLVTSPLRTACDLACDEPYDQDADIRSTILKLLHRNKLTPSFCLKMLDDNPRWPGHAIGVAIFTDMKATFDSWNDRD